MSRKPYEICPIACKFRGMCLLHCNLKLNQTDTCLEGHIQEFTNERINYTSLEILFDLWINILKGFQGILTQSLVYGTHYVVYSSFKIKATPGVIGEKVTLKPNQLHACI